MKNSFVGGGLVISLFTALVLGASPLGAQISPNALSLQEIAAQLQHPEEIARFIWRHFRFTSDQTHFGVEERWQSPDELLATRQGDCEDFALFAHEILKRQGIPSFLINVYGGGQAHTVCLFKKAGRFHVIDGTSFNSYSAQNLKEIFSKIDPFWKQAAIVGFSETTHRGKILKSFERS